MLETKGSAVNATSEVHPWHCKGWSGGWTTLSGGTIQVEEPATGDLLAEVGRASTQDVRRAARAARAAQHGWIALPYQERGASFRRAATLVESRAALIRDWIVRETGAVKLKAQFEITSVVHLLHEAAAVQTQPRGLVLPADGGSLSLARRVPHGVVGVITPFNFPFILTGRAILPALAMGNAVVLKPDPRTPVSGGLLLASIFAEAGLPEDLLHVLPGDVEAGEALVADPDIAMISFTGSTAVGRKIGSLAGGHLKKVALELGGKNALIILDDADLDRAVSNGAWASWLHQGQICMSAGRHLVHKSLAEAYAERMAEKARALPVGNPFTEEVALGPLINRVQLERVRRIVDDSIAAGARLLAGGPGQGNFFNPTVLDRVTPEMPAFREEIFGPVVSITAFEDDEQAVRLANDTEYGLSAGILSPSIERAKRIADQLNVGLLHINDQTVHDDGTMPMGGFGASGNGSRHGGPANWDEFTQWQWMTIKEKPPLYPL
ncbi:benzaldehyde dehydrogenase [Xanthobacter autotrophicus]|uniref:benzaldehyde dehydrogenase n=1 Tax=Xanthobacter autotrophicus TaxID=280 RepID=UPI00372BDCBA